MLLFFSALDSTRQFKTVIFLHKYLMPGVLLRPYNVWLKRPGSIGWGVGVGPFELKGPYHVDHLFIEVKMFIRLSATIVTAPRHSA